VVPIVYWSGVMPFSLTTTCTGMIHSRIVRLQRDSFRWSRVVGSRDESGVFLT
jgi:hypothetical protein